MLITDADARIQRVNQAFTSITGYSVEDVVGKEPSMLSSGRQDSAFYASMWSSINDTGSWEGEIWNRRKNGSIYPEHLTITAVKDKAGIVTNYVGALTDSTQRVQALEQLRSTTGELELANAQIEEERAKLAERIEQRTEQLRQANHAKDSFLATMSHEIRTPLGGLLGMMELLNLSTLNAEQRQQLQTAQLSGKNLLRIVNDILDWSKIEAGKLEISPQNATIADMLHGVASTYAQLASDKNITLKVNIDPQLSHDHIFDPLRLSQILSNFTSNAVKFTPQGSVEISAQRLENHIGYETVRFSVKDSGHGIDKEQQSRLFQHYEQATADTARMYGGTGLGLAICRRLAELMDGTLSVESTIGVGSTFNFTLSLPVASVIPLVAASESSRTATGTAAQQDNGVEAPLTVDGRPLSVLIVDDHPVNRMLLKQQLSMLGVTVESAESGTPALVLWQRTEFDIIITDCHMPEMDGYELTCKIRGIEAQTETSIHIPIIAWTANVLSDEVERCQIAGMDDFLTKPTELADLRAMLVKWMNRK
jgi:PAS domain S-box-containing protein